MKKLLYFSATWCGPCKQLGPIMNEVSLDIPVKKIDVDQESGIAQKYGIRNVPTVILINERGQELAKKIGFNPKQAYLDMYNQN